jgi:tetratricopeptide (TPR) repeat protein
MTQGEMESMMMSLYFSGQADECINKGEQCLKYFPKSLAINRFYFRTLTQKKKFKEAIEAFDKLKVAESPKVGAPILELEDSLNLGRALAGTKKYEQAQALYDEILSKPGLQERQRKNIDIFISELMSSRIKDYTDLGDYQKAVDLYKTFVDKRRAEGTLTDDILSSYAKIYRDWSTELNGAEKATVLMKTDPIYAEGQTTSKENKDLFLYNRFFIRFSLDPEIKTEEPLPYAKELVDMLLAIPSRDRGQNARLLMGYEYLMRFEYFHKKNKKGAIAIAEKMLDIDPAHQTALQFISVLSK